MIWPGEVRGFMQEIADINNRSICTLLYSFPQQLMTLNMHMVHLNYEVYYWVSFTSRSIVSDSVTPRTVAHQASLPMEFSRREYWSGLPFPSPEELPTLEPWSPAWQADSLLFELQGPLLDTWFANIFFPFCRLTFHSVDCFFAIQKLSSLISSHRLMFFSVACALGVMSKKITATIYVEYYCSNYVILTKHLSNPHLIIS